MSANGVTPQEDNPMSNRFKYNVNTNAIEEDGKFLAYVDVIDSHNITRRLNELYYENKELKEAINKAQFNKALGQREYNQELQKEHW